MKTPWRLLGVSTSTAQLYQLSLLGQDLMKAEESRETFFLVDKVVDSWSQESMKSWSSVIQVIVSGPILETQKQFLGFCVSGGVIKADGSR